MTSLAKHFPLNRLVLPGMGEVNCSGLTLIVGPNSSGKSQLLRDIHGKVSGEPRRLVVAQEIDIKRLALDPLLSDLSAAGYIRPFSDENGANFYLPMTTYVGSGRSAAQIDSNQLKNWHQSHAKPEFSMRRDQYLGYLGGFLVTALFLDQRLSALAGAGMIDFIANPPSHDLHALYMNPVARGLLAQELEASFSKGVWPDTSRGTGVWLRISDGGGVPSAEDRLDPIKMNAYRTIDTEGDGLKSYTATCVSLLLGRRPLCLVDEPEMCLHPPQAYNLGKFIGQYGAIEGGATFVATHSSHVLRGVLQVTSEIQIIRLTRVAGDFRAHLMSAELLASTTKKPTVRVESVLDGIFSQCVIVVESDTDRTVYQAVWDKIERARRLDVHIASVGGIGGISDITKLYSALEIPVAVIADLDLITDPVQVERILQALGVSDSGDLVRETRDIVSQIKSLPPTISEQSTRDEINKILSGEFNWSENGDATVRRELDSISKQLDRMRRLKGTKEYPLPPAIQEALSALLSRLAVHGLFLVPIGELESWLSECKIQSSRIRKGEWANEAAAFIKANPVRNDDIWDFIRRVGEFLQSRYA